MCREGARPSLAATAPRPSPASGHGVKPHPDNSSTSTHPLLGEVLGRSPQVERHAHSPRGRHALSARELPMAAYNLSVGTKPKPRGRGDARTLLSSLVPTRPFPGRGGPATPGPGDADDDLYLDPEEAVVATAPGPHAIPWHPSRVESPDSPRPPARPCVGELYESSSLSQRGWGRRRATTPHTPKPPTLEGRADHRPKRTRAAAHPHQRQTRHTRLDMNM